MKKLPPLVFFYFAAWPIVGLDITDRPTLFGGRLLEVVKLVMARHLSAIAIHMTEKQRHIYTQRQKKSDGD